MNYAIDKDVIVKQLIGGYAQKLEGQMLGPSGTGYDPDIKAFPYDPAKAKALLAEAGYPNGFTVNFQSPDGRYIADKAVSQEVVSQLAKVGITAKLEFLESAVFVQKANNGTFEPMLTIGTTWAPSMDLEAALPGFTICCGNNKDYANPRMDELFKQSQTTVDATARAGVLKQITKLMYDDAPALYLFQIPGIYAAAKNIKGLEFRADYSIKDILKVSVVAP
jgi:peptide/nickel transport system substrate-binding protein